MAQDGEVVRDSRLPGAENPLDLPHLQLLTGEKTDGSQPERVGESGQGGGGVQHPQIISQNHAGLIYQGTGRKISLEEPGRRRGREDFFERGIQGQRT